MIDHNLPLGTDEDLRSSRTKKDYCRSKIPSICKSINTEPERIKSEPKKIINNNLFNLFWFGINRFAYRWFFSSTIIFFGSMFRFFGSKSP